MKILLLALRSLRREWHLPELRTLAASLVLAVVALGVVATLATRIERGMLASAAELIAAGPAAGIRRQGTPGRPATRPHRRLPQRSVRA